MKITYFISRDFHTVSPYAGIPAIRENLLREKALVVWDEENEKILGILTPDDIIKKPHNLVIDCLSEKKPLRFSCPVEEALQEMKAQDTDVLPVFKNHRFEGLLFQNDLLQFMANERKKLEGKVAIKSKELQKSLMEREESESVLRALYDSTRSVKILVDPNYRVLFFNRNASELALLFHNKKVKTGDNLLEYTRENLSEILHFLREDFSKALEGEPASRECVIKHKDAQLWLEVNYTPVYENNQVIGISLTVEDISKKKQRELFIEQQNQLLRQVFNSHSHEMRKPVANILGLLELLDKNNLNKYNTEIFDLLKCSTNELDEVFKEVIKKAYTLQRDQLSL